MKRLCITLIACISCLASPHFVSAQNLYGTTTLDIDPDTGIVTATCETDLDGALVGYYGAFVYCSVVDSNGISIVHGEYNDPNGAQGYAQVVLTFNGTPGVTYTARGTHGADPVLGDYAEPNPGQPAEYEYVDPYNFQSFTADAAGADYLESYDWFGPGPEVTTRLHTLRIGNTHDVQTYQQKPTASRIVQTVINQGTVGCPAGQSGWTRQVLKIVTDQKGGDIVVGGQSLTEGVTINARNDLNLPQQVQTGTTATNSAGQFTDTLSFCSAACPASTGESDATQVIGDTYGGTKYTPSSNAFAYKCTSNTINGQ